MTSSGGSWNASNHQLRETVLTREARAVSGTKIVVGIDPDGRDLCIPTSGVNVLITGGMGNGKSYAVGLMAERLMCSGHSVLLLDPKGDNSGLADLTNVAVIGAQGRSLPEPETLVNEILPSLVNLVIDLSRLDGESCTSYLGPLLTHLQARRLSTRFPQWLILDEAHLALNPRDTQYALELVDKDVCLATWRPDDLPIHALMALDVVIALNGTLPTNTVVDVTAAVGQLPRANIARLLDGNPGQGVLVQRGHPGEAVILTLASRRTGHARHGSRSGRLPPDGPTFYFRTSSPGGPTGESASNLAALEVVLARCSRDVLRHHCRQNDFSTWVGEALGDAVLAVEIKAAESQLRPDSGDAIVEDVRVRLIAALQSALATGVQSSVSS